MGVAATAGAGLARGLAGIAGVVAAGVGFARLAGDSNAFVSAMSEVSTLVDEATFDMASLSDEALRMAGEFGSMPTEQASAFYQAISAGADTAEKATAALEAANRLAIGGVTDVGTAVDGLTSAMNAYGGEAGSFTDISDAMFTAVKAGKTTVGELSANIGKLAPIAATAGVSLDEVFAATAALTKGGVATSTSMDGLRAVMAAVLKPTQEAAKAADRMGLDFNAAALESKGLAGFLEDVAVKTGGSTEEMALLFGGVEALTPVLALTGKSSGDFATILGDMGDKAGATQEAFDKMANSPGFQMDRILSGLSAGFTGLGSSMLQSAVPALRAVADIIPIVFAAIDSAIGTATGLWESFTDALANSDAWPFDALRQMGAAIGAIGDFISPVVPYLGEFAGAAAAVGAALLAWSALPAIVGAVGSALGLVAAIVFTPVTLGIAAVAAGAVLIRNNWDGITAWWSGLWEGLDGDVSQFAGRLVTSIGGLVADFGRVALELATSFADRLSDGIGSALGSVQWPTAADLARSAARLIVSFGEIAVSMTNALALGISSRTRTLGSDIDWPSGAQIVAGARTLITAFADTARDMADAFASEIGPGLRAAFSSIDWPAAREVIASAADMVRGFGETAGAALRALGTQLGTGLARLINDINWPSVGAIISSAAELVGAFGQVALAARGALINGIVAALRGFANEIDWPTGAAIRSGASRLIDGFADLASDAIDSLTDGFGDVGSAVDGIRWPTGAEIGTAAADLIQGFAELAGDAIGALVDGFGTSRDWLATLDWPTPAEVGRAAAQLIVGFVDLAVDAIAAFARGMGASDGFLAQVDWPTPEEIVRAASGLVAGFARAAFEAVGAFVLELGVGLKGVFDDIDWPDSNDIKTAAASALNGFADLALGLVDALVDGLKGLGAAAVDGIKSGLEGTSTVVRDAFADMVEDVPLVGSMVAAQMRRVGEDGSAGYAQGLRDGTETVARASEELAAIPETVTRAITETQSPSRVMMAVGRDVGLGFAIGILETSSDVERAAAGLSANAIPAFERATESILTTRIRLTEGDEALRRYELSVRDITGSAQDWIIEQEAINDALYEQASLMAELEQGIVDSLTNADSVKDAFSDLGDWLTDWLKKKAAEFAASQLMSYLGSFFGGTSSGQQTTASGSGMGPDGSSSGGGDSTALLALAGPVGAALGAVVMIADYFEGRMDATDPVRGGANADVANFLYTGQALAQQEEIKARFAEIDATLTEQFQMMGAAGLDSVIGLIDSSITEIRALTGGYELSLAKAIEQKTRDAIQAAAGQLGPEMQALIGEAVDLAATPMSEIITLFGQLSETVQRFAPALEAAGLMFGRNADEQAATTIRLVESMGGAEAATATFQLLLTEFADSTSVANMAILESNRALDRWRDQLGGATEISRESLDGMVASLDLTGSAATAAQSVIDQFTVGTDSATGAITVNVDALRVYRDGLDGLAATGSELAPVLISVVDALIAGGTAGADAQIGLAAYRDVIDASGRAGMVASDQFDAFVIGADSASGALTLNRAALAVYIEGLDRSTESGEQAYQSAIALSEAHGLTGVAAIQTREAMMEYLGTLDLTSEAGLAAFNAARPYLQALVETENEQRRLTAVYEGVVDVASRLNLRFDATAPSAVGAADALAELMGGMDALRSATQRYYEEFYTETERLAISQRDAASAVIAWNATLTDADLALAGITDGTIDTRDEFRRYVESLDLNTEAGQRATATALELQESFLIVADGSGTLTEQLVASQAQLALTSSSLDTNFAAMAETAGEQSEAVQSALGDAFVAVVSDATTTGENLTERLGSAFTTVLTDAGILSENMPPELRQGFEVMVNDTASAAADLVAQSGIGSGALVGLADSVGGATPPVNGLANASDNLGGSAGSAVGALERFQSGLRGVGVIADGVDGQLDRIRANIAEYERTGIPQGFATGLDRVMAPEMTVRVHQDEMIMRGDIANQFRALGGTATRLPDFSANSPSINLSPIVRSGAQDNSALVARMDKLIEQNEKLRGELESQADRRDNITSNIAGSNEAQRAELRALRRENERLSRRLAKQAA